MVAAAFERLRLREVKGQMLVLLALGLLFVLVAVFSSFSSMRGGEESGGEMRTKSLVYDAGPNGRIGLYWMDNEANMRKATSEELKRCEELYPDEEIPVCQMTYYEQDAKEQ